MKKHNPYHYQLDLPVEFVPHSVDMTGLYHTVYPINRLNQEFKEWFWKLDLVIGHGEQFLLQPNARDFHIIHTDGFGAIPIVKLNYVYCDTPHLMNWYKRKPGIELSKKVSPANTPYGECDPENCELVYSAQCGKPSLVNVMELHDVSKVSSPRVCYSFVLFHRRPAPNNLSWSEAEEIFQDYIVEL